jgi:phage gp36-like protein
MAYCGVNDVRLALTGDATATSGTNTAADLSDPQIQDSVNESSAVVDAYIDGPYDPRVDDIPAIVRFWTRDIAAYFATLVWRKSKSPAANDPVILRYNHAMSMLAGVAAGTITIFGPQNSSDEPSVVNPSFGGGLIRRSDFDLTGRDDNDDGFPVWIKDGQVIWTGFQN